MSLPLRIAAALAWISALLLLAVAIRLRDPHLFAARAYLLPGIGTATLLALLLSARVKRPGIGVNLWRAVITASAVVALVAEGRFQLYKGAVLAAPPEALRLGERFVVGYTRIEEVTPLVASGLAGGIFITRRNATGRSCEELRAEIASLQAARAAVGLPPLLVTTDQEGGIVSRLSPPLSRPPPLASLVEAHPAPGQLEAEAEAYGRRQGAELAALGVNVDFSPVVDLQVDRQDSALDFHSLIRQRAISPDPRQVTQVALPYSRGLLRQGVMPTLKHFPGLGGVPQDTHHFSATLTTPRAQLEQRDWLPFRRIAEAVNPLIMLGHVTLPEFDPDNPASFSRPVIQQLLRGEWHHDGPLITDDLTMAAAYDRGLCEVTVKALNAGVDLLLVSFDHEQYYDAMYCAAAALKEGRLDQQLLSDSRERLLRMRQRIAAPSPELAGIGESSRSSRP